MRRVRQRKYLGLKTGTSPTRPYRTETPAPSPAISNRAIRRSRTARIARPPTARCSDQTAISQRTSAWRAARDTGCALVVLDESRTSGTGGADAIHVDHEGDFQASEVVSPHSEGGVVNYEHRSSRVLMDIGHHHDVVLERVKSVLPQILEKLGMEAFAITGVEAQVTASNDGDFFHFHSDNASERVASRSLTFVYFFHREPRGFEGGELRIHDARLEQGSYVSEESYQTIIPQQNQMVFFPCELLHEVTAVRCASQLFGDSRFTLNGWLRH